MNLGDVVRVLEVPAPHPREADLPAPAAPHPAPAEPAVPAGAPSEDASRRPAGVP